MDHGFRGTEELRRNINSRKSQNEKTQMMKTKEKSAANSKLNPNNLQLATLTKL